MFKLAFVVFANIYGVISKESLFIPEFEETLVYTQIPTRADKLLDFSEFGPLTNFQRHATNVNESIYPWMALMFRSKSNDMNPYSTVTSEQPYCSAINIQERIFMTSARCVYNQRVDFVWLFMDFHLFSVQAFVMPNLFSKQAFDDIGLVVVKKEHTFSKWNPVKLYSKNKRNDHNYKWFSKSDINNPNGRTFKAIGFASKVLMSTTRMNSVYLLFELDVVIDIQSCIEFHTKRHKKKYTHHDGFEVPCYGYCTLKEWRKNMSGCWFSLEPNGGAVYNPKTKEVVGVATWGSEPNLAQPPVGFAVPNTNTFYEDYECAQKIRNDKTENVQRHYYQKLCDKK